MLRAFGLDIPQTLEAVCDPASMALIVYDMQVGIVKQVKDGAQVTCKVVRVPEAARQAGMRVIFTRHLSLPKELMGAFQLRTAMAWQRVKTVEEVKPWFCETRPDFKLFRNSSRCPAMPSSTRLRCRPSRALPSTLHSGIATSPPSRSWESRWKSASSRRCATALI